MKNIKDIENRLFGGDNLEWLKQFPSESIDLIYLDPPFRTNRDFKINDDETEEIRGFEDKNKTFGDGTMKGYIDIIGLRLQELHRILKPTGLIYLHCDSHASHYLKIKMDEIFGFDNFKNEIIWSYKRWTVGDKNFQRMHDIILFYSKTNDYCFNKQYQPFSEKTSIAKYKRKIENGRSIQDKENLMERNPEKGVSMSDVWDISFLHPMSKERLNSSTQKPEELLERIIKASSNEGYIVLDPYCGSGTTLAVTKRLNRKYIGIDHSSQACKVTAQRLFIPQENIIILQSDFFNKDERIKTIKELENDLKNHSSYKLQDWVCQKLEFTNTGHSDKHSGSDGGKDGYKIVTSKDYNGLCYLEVKSGNSGVGIDAVKKMHSTLIQDNVKRAIMIGFTYTDNAYQTAKQLSKTGISIELYTINDILNVMNSKMNGSMESLLKLKYKVFEDRQVRFT